MFSYNFIVAAILDQESGIFFMSIHYYEPFNTRQVFLNIVRMKLGYSPLNAENGLSVAFCFVVAYAHEKINFLASILYIIFFLFYDVNLNTQDFVYLEIVKYQLGLRKNMPVFEMQYSCFIYMHVHTVFQYQNKLYIFPIVGLAILLCWSPY